MRIGLNSFVWLPRIVYVYVGRIYCDQIQMLTSQRSSVDKEAVRMRVRFAHTIVETTTSTAKRTRDSGSNVLPYENWESRVKSRERVSRCARDVKRDGDETTCSETRDADESRGDLVRSFENSCSLLVVFVILCPHNLRRASP